MIIEDIKGNIITNPNLEKGKLEKSFRTNEQGEQYDIYIYFPFSEDEQIAYNVNNQSSITTDKANCQVFEATKSSLTDTDPFAYAFARRIKRGEVTLEQCPSELQSKIEEIIAPSGSCAVSAHAHNGTITGQGTTVDYPRSSSMVLTLTPNQGYRVPTVDEMPSVTTFTARDTENKSIADFRTNYVVYNNGIYTITIPENCASIYGCIYCISDNSDKLPKVNRKEHAAPTENKKKKKATKKRK